MGKPIGKWSLGRRWVDNIKLDIRKAGYEEGRRMGLTPRPVQWHLDIADLLSEC
jgi:hypothetical protein